MHKIKYLAVVFFGLISMNAFAYSCADHKEYTEIRIDGIEDRRPEKSCGDNLKDMLSKPAVFYFSSPGGYIDHIHDFVDELKGMFESARKYSGTLPTMVVHTECQSACIPILSGFNQLAKKNLIALFIEPNTVIGFHGCSDNYEEEPKLRFTVEGTDRYLGYLESLGCSRAWIEANRSLFATATITEFKPTDERLTHSGILDYAIISAWI